MKERHALGARIEAARRITPRVSVNARLSWEDRHYRTSTSFDGPAGDITLGGSYVITPTVRADLTLGYGRDRPDR